MYLYFPCTCTITVESMTMWKFLVDDKMKITEWKICEKSLKINYIHHVKHFSFFSTFNGNWNLFELNWIQFNSYFLFGKCSSLSWKLNGKFDISHCVSDGKKNENHIFPPFPNACWFWECLMEGLGVKVESLWVSIGRKGGGEEVQVNSVRYQACTYMKNPVGSGVNSISDPL